MPKPDIRFATRTDFRRELHARVDEYFARAGLAVRAPLAMYRKSAVVIAWAGVSYALLVFFSTEWWQAAICSLSLALAIAALSFNVPHDGSHGSYSRFPALNRAMAFAFDLAGASSYVWHWKHNVLHHGFTNIVGADDDINLAGFGRLAPAQPHRFFHRLQHYYLWALYGLIVLKWQLIDDFRDVIVGKVGQRPIPRPKGFEAVAFAVGKLLWIGVFIAIPLMVHPWQVVLVTYLATVFVLGVVISVVFQLAHCVEEAEFVPPPGPEEVIQNEWAAHQVETTVNFSPKSRLITWFVGGLNYQIEHHLFPSISHVHYPALAPIVAEVCRKHGVRHYTHPTLLSALASHYGWLREMARPPTAALAGG
jgi:linoleoyl-CoA desaturase